ncbi:MAG: hypothetical protein OES09_10415 [Gammaproteobacteria bacterium]|nr:hypothetical protein [Gammaproteobacteria bacterium]
MSAKCGILIALGGVLGACVYTPEGVPPRAAEPSVGPPRVITTTNGSDAELAQFLSLKRRAAEAVETEWRVLYDDAKANPSISARDRRIRLALLLGAPHRPEPDWKQAERLLDLLLSGDESDWSESMRDLLAVTKHEIVRRGKLVDRVKQLHSQRNELETNVERLEQDLAEATEKIQALTNIEQSIERPKGSETP